MAIRRNKYRIGIGLVVIGMTAIAAAMGTLYRPTSVAERTFAPLPLNAHTSRKPSPKPAADADRAPVVVEDISGNWLANSSGSSAATAKAAGPVPAAPSLAYTPNLLVFPTEFKDPQFAQRAHVLDARWTDSYFPKHISGSINTEAKEWIAAFISDPSQPSWEKRISALGIDRNAPIIICDEGVSKDAASVRAILRYWGFTDVRLLNGGWHAWLATGGPRDAREPHPARQAVQLEPAHGLFLTRGQVLSVLPAGDVQLIDACTTTAAQPSIELRDAAESSDSANVKRLAWASIMAWRRSPTFSPAELDRLVRAAGIDPAQPTVVCSESFGDAAAVSFALELLGARNVQICFPGWKGAPVSTASNN